MQNLVDLHYLLHTTLLYLYHL